ncbi:unnamed protein product [Urochloa humidicola]
MAPRPSAWGVSGVGRGNERASPSAAQRLGEAVRSKTTRTAMSTGWSRIWQQRGLRCHVIFEKLKGVIVNNISSQLNYLRVNKLSGKTKWKHPWRGSPVVEQIMHSGLKMR